MVDWLPRTIPFKKVTFYKRMDRCSLSLITLVELFKPMATGMRDSTRMDKNMVLVNTNITIKYF